MIRIPFWIVLVIAVPLWIYKRLQYLRANPRSFGLLREIQLHLFFAYLLAVTYVTQFPLDFNLSFHRERSFNYIPFVAMKWLFFDPVFAVLNIAGNVVMFVPLGIFVPFLYKRFDHLGKVTLFGFLCSDLIEFLQYLSGIRSADIDDILLNTLGALIGYAIWSFFKKAIIGRERVGMPRKSV